jgi:NAD(P)-dependent dehydrogenase (short-subunit alcohol dehydrogenase family)
MKKKLADQVAIVTGAGQGIGAAIAERLARDGASVVLADINEDQVQRTAEGLKSRGSDVLASIVDVTKKDQVSDMVDQVVARFGTVDILVNNAGIIRDGFVANISEQDWDQVIDVNLKGAFLCCQAVFPVMKERLEGKIVNITSRSWLGNIGQANYSASKGGLVSLTRTLALEFARYQINVNAVAPGLIDTPMTRGMPERSLERLLHMQPTGKMGTVDDIAAAVSFLASGDAGFITGQVLHVDGGKSCGLLSL